MAWCFPLVFMMPTMMMLQPSPLPRSQSPIPHPPQPLWTNQPRESPSTSMLSNADPMQPTRHGLALPIIAHGNDNDVDATSLPTTDSASLLCHLSHNPLNTSNKPPKREAHWPWCYLHPSIKLKITQQVGASLPKSEFDWLSQFPMEKHWLFFVQTGYSMRSMVVAFEIELLVQFVPVPHLQRQTAWNVKYWVMFVKDPL